VRISAKTDYALRATTQLAAAGDDTLVKAEALSSAQDIPLPFLLSILADLRAAGLVVSKRGGDGGYRLAAPAQDIAVADVIRAIDGPLANIAGALPEHVAYAGPAAALRDTWVALRATIRKVLENVTLADIVDGRLPPDIAALVADDDAWIARITR